DYMALLKDSFHPANLEQVMCRDLISVDWRGRLFDCDFNQQLGLGLAPVDPGDEGRQYPYLRDLLDTDFARGPIVIADHCYGCTAGQGSSCGGVLVAPGPAP
ncbi:MAG: DUF3641 domain-containing protein, partial [Chromatiaceae bacterium]|nr:DUF3641 domain-containing protein [Chromatiaceae bacterium]